MTKDVHEDASNAALKNGDAAATAASPPLRVLTLGDGNFSFSLAYLRRLQQLHKAIDFVASSFDAYDELVAKYPESARIIEQLRELGARVLHRVDATNVHVSLANAAGGSSVVDGSSVVAAPFDEIVFNHPHCGEENVQRHQSLLSHFYVSAKELLRESQPAARLVLTLAHGQPERWEALARARRAGLALVEQHDDADAHPRYGVSYERKRHQNGKSFHRVLLHGERLQQQSTLFVFTRAANNDNGSTAAKANAVDTATTTRATSADCKDRKRKADDDAPTTEFACAPCAKSFKTAQGLRTHVRMVHELAANGNGSSSSSGVTLRCEDCERTFKQEDALRQHRIAKHGRDRHIPPDWFRARAHATTASLDNDSGDPLACAICGFSFASRDAMDAHWTQLRPKNVVRRRCVQCDRAFDEERALRQHQNYCLAANASTT